MAGNGIVTLEFVADTKKFVEGTAQVSHSSKQVEQDLENATKATSRHNYQNMVAAHGVRELASASLMLSSQLPQSAQTMSLAAMSAGDLAGAYFRIKPAAANALAGIGALRAGLIGLAATTALVTVAATNNKTGWANLQQDGFKAAAAQLSILDNMVQKVPGHLGFLGSALDGVTDKLRTNAGWSHTAAAAQADLAAQAQRTALILAQAHEASLFQNPDENPGGDATFTTADAAAISMQVYDQGTPGYAQRAMEESGLFKTRAASGAANAVAQEAKRLAEQRLQEWQSVADKYTQVAKQIAESLAPKVEARQDGGSSLIEKMRKQLLDTIQLRKDLSRLSSLHLNKDTMKTLVEGGLSSLPAAEEILGGGRGGVGAVNDLNRQINAQAFRIGSSEAQREFKNRDREVTVKFDINGGDAEFKRMFKKWIRTDGAVSFGLKAA